jgi:thymidylate synthase
MKKPLKNNSIGLDTSADLVYNTDMIRNTNTNERRNEMKSLKEIIESYPSKVAFQMDRGLTNETDQIKEIVRVLRHLGNSRRVVNYYMSVDEDFISDVLGCYPK